MERVHAEAREKEGPTDREIEAAEHQADLDEQMAVERDQEDRLMNQKPYDSTNDTLEHIDRVRSHMGAAAWMLHKRAMLHDRSKLEAPEKQGYDVITYRLKDLVYGSDEYRAALRELKPTLDHHYAHNSHHPEHHPEGIAGMSLLDVVEMLMDWKAATERMKDGGDIWASIEYNIGRFRIEPQLAQILRNTAREMQWPRKERKP